MAEIKRRYINKALALVAAWRVCCDAVHFFFFFFFSFTGDYTGRPVVAIPLDSFGA